MSVRGSHKIALSLSLSLSALCKSARDPNTGYRRRPDSRVPMRILKSKHLCTSGGLSPGRNTLSYVHHHHHHRLSISITCVTRVCRNNLIHFSGAMLTNPAFNPAPLDATFWFSLYRGPRFNYFIPLYLSLPPPPPSLFRFHGIRVIEFTGERMENMEEGFENVSRMELEYVFLRFVLLVSRTVYKRYVNFSGCGCVCVLK